MGPGITLGVYLKAISSSGSLLLLLLLHFHEGIIAGASSASVSPMEQKCDKVVAVESPEILSYLGNVTFGVPAPFRGRWTTIIKFTSPYTFIGGWGVEVQSFGRKAYAIFKLNEDVNLKSGDQVIFQFRVLYGYNAKVPKVLSIRWEDRTVCGAPILITRQFVEESDEDEDIISNESGSGYDNSSGNTQHHLATNHVRLAD